MDVSTPIRPIQSAPESASWDWRRELKSLDAQLSAVERDHAWDWRAELAELEDRLGQLERKHGLTL